MEGWQFFLGGLIFVIGMFSYVYLSTRKMYQGKPIYKLKHTGLYSVLSDIRPKYNLMVVQSWATAGKKSEIFLFCPKKYSAEPDIKEGSRLRVFDDELLFVD